MKFPTIKLDQLGLVALGLCLFSCSAPKLHGSNRAILDQAVERLDQGKYQEVTNLSDSLVFATAGVANEYRTQRFFAAYLGAQAHLRASFDGAFFEPPQKKRGLGIGQRGADAGSSVAHMVAFCRDAGYSLDWLPGATTTATLAPLVPPSLANLGTTNARDNLTLALMTVYTRMGFFDKITTSLNDSPEMLDLDKCNAMLERTKFLPAARPWVMYMVFNHLKDSDPPMAFRFAAEALFNELGDGPDNKMRQWIRNGSTFSITCPDGDHPADPNRKRCDDGRELRDFIFIRKS